MAWAWVTSVVLQCTFLIRTKPSDQWRIGYDTSNIERVWNIGTRYSLLGPRTSSTVKFGINLRLFSIVFTTCSESWHELHLILYFQLNHYWTRRNVYLFTRPNLRIGKADHSHLQYILALYEYISSFVLTLIRGCRALCIERNLISSIVNEIYYEKIGSCSLSHGS